MKQLPFSSIYYADECGNVFSDHRGSLLKMKPWQNNNGYKMVYLRVSGRTIRLLVHRIVCVLYNGQPDRFDLEVRHKDADRANCHFSNLEWGTRQDNIRDKMNHMLVGITVPDYTNRRRGTQHPFVLNPELVRRGERSPRAKLSEIQVRDILRRCRAGEAPGRLAREYGVSRWAVRKIFKCENWKHVSE